jgi:hypothetical protein
MLARCAHCQASFTAERFGRQVCPHCGAQLHLAVPAPGGVGPAPASSPAGPPPLPPPAPAAGWGPVEDGSPEAARPSPFAASRGWLLLQGYARTWGLVLTRPRAFFRGLRLDQPGSAVLFGVITVMLGTLLPALVGGASSPRWRRRSPGPSRSWRPG